MNVRHHCSSPGTHCSSPGTHCRSAVWLAAGFLAVAAVMAFQAAAAPGPAETATSGAPAAGWARTLGGGSRDWALAVLVDAEGAAYVLGHFHGEMSLGEGQPTVLRSAGDSDVFLAKLDAGGRFLWARRFGGHGQDEGRALAAGDGGAVYLTGFFSGAADFGAGADLVSAGASDVFVARLDAEGRTEWAHGIGGERGDVGYAAAGDAGGVVVSGYFQARVDFDPGDGDAPLASAGASDAFVARLDARGRLLWARAFGGPRDDQGRAVAVGEAGDVFVLGNFTGEIGDGDRRLESAGSTDVFLWRLEAAGTTLAVRRFGGPGPDSGERLAAVAGGGLYVTGSFSDALRLGTIELAGAGLSDAFVVRLDGEGNALWAEAVGGGGTDLGFGIAADPDGGAWAVGFSQLPQSEAKFSGEAVSYAVHFAADGRRQAARQLRGDPAVQALAVDLDPSGTPYVAGTFRGTAAFELGGQTVELPEAGKFDAFVVRLGLP